MKYKIVAVGKLKEKFFRDAFEEYAARISRFAEVETVEVKESLFRGNPEKGDVEKILKNEAEEILPKLEGFVVATDIDGKMLKSTEFCEKLTAAKQRFSAVTFVVGGSYGLDISVKNRADLRFSFGQITLPHQLARVVLAEQIYRACAISSGSAYHK